VDGRGVSLGSWLRSPGGHGQDGAIGGNAELELGAAGAMARAPCRHMRCAVRSPAAGYEPTLLSGRALGGARHSVTTGLKRSRWVPGIAGPPRSAGTLRRRRTSRSSREPGAAPPGFGDTSRRERTTCTWSGSGRRDGRRPPPGSGTWVAPCGDGIRGWLGACRCPGRHSAPHRAPPRSPTRCPTVDGTGGRLMGPPRRGASSRSGCSFVPGATALVTRRR